MRETRNGEYQLHAASKPGAAAAVYNWSVCPGDAMPEANMDGYEAVCDSETATWG
ncbi:MAG: hypothetical protein IT365_28410 [Candidatus Hydrogenedentes bacterium]|nr:hypothetical protein [Candidatus Hydrogenedentota bacterium]